MKFILVIKNGKKPIEDKWQKINNYSELDDKLNNHLLKGGNYGVLCGSGLIVIDADTDELNDMVKERLPETFTVKTSKGYHYYYTCLGFTKKKVLKDGAFHLGEIQSTGSFVVGANSTHESGTVYQISNDKPIEIINKEDIDKVLGNYYDNSISTKIDTDIFEKGVDEGSRNDSLFRLACSLRGKGVNHVDAFNTLSYVNNKSSDGLTENELSAILKSAFSYENTNLKVEEKFNIKNKILKLNDYLENSETFFKQQAFFCDDQENFWLWNIIKHRWELVDTIDLMNAIEYQLGLSGETIFATIKKNYLETFKRVGRFKKPKAAPKKWVQFKDKAFSITSKNIYKVTPDYFFTNPIPFKIGEKSDTPIIDKLFTEWVGEKYVSTLYELIAYCCYTDYPIQVLFCLYGTGRNGKSCFLRLLSNFLGHKNICSSDLDLLVGRNMNRFESYKLYKKLVCLMGETNFNILENSSLLKKLTGADMIGYEKKGKGGFDDYNYAKILIASNSLPTSEDTSEGFYRRWIIIDFPNKFPEGKDILITVPKEEYENLAKKVCEILSNLIQNGKFTNQGSIADRRRKYILSSNPLPLFIEKFCFPDANGYIRYSEFYIKYTGYLGKINKRIISKKEFSKSLLNEGLENRKTSKEGIIDFYVEGVSLRADYDELIKKEAEKVEDLPDLPNLPTSNFSPCIVTVKDNIKQSGKSGKNVAKFIEKTPEFSFEALKSELNLENDKEVSGIITNMLKKGEIYESKPGHYKAL